MAADPRQRAAPFGHHRRRVVGAPRAVERSARLHTLRARDGGLALGELAQPDFDAVGRKMRRQTLGDDARDDPRREVAHRGQQPFAVLVEFPHDARALSTGSVVELLLDLVLHDGALFLDDEDLVEVSAECRHALFVEGPGHPDLVQADADFPRLALADAEVVEGLAHGQVGLSRCDDAEMRSRAVDHGLIQVIGARECDGGVELVAVEHLLLLEGTHADAEVQPLARKLEVIRDLDLYAIDVRVHRGRAVHRVGQRDHCGPTSRVA